MFLANHNSWDLVFLADHISEITKQKQDKTIRFFYHNPYTHTSS